MKYDKEFRNGFGWSQLPRSWKTEDAYQVFNLLKEYRITARTKPDEFSAPTGDWKMLFMDSETVWPVFVKTRQLEQAISILTEERLL